MLSVVAVLALLVTWVVNSGGGGGSNDADGSNGKNPVPSTITPGPSDSGPAISQAPGGRDESSDGGSSGSGSGGGSSSGGESSGAGESGGTSGSGDGVNGDGGGTGDTLPANSTLPNCTAGVVTLSVRSARNTYAPGETPTLELTAKNSSGSDCKVDLGPKSAVVTITQAGSSDDFWASDDCPKGAGSLLYRVSAGAGVTYAVEWDRKPSAPECATPPAGVAGAGTYLVEVKTAGFGKVQTSFVLEND